MADDTPNAAPEFSRPVLIEKVTAGGSTYKIEADPAEREALARRFGIIAIDALSAEVTVRSGAKGAVKLAGELKAHVRQACVVTLAEVPAQHAEPFDRHYAPPPRDEAPEDIVVDFDADDPPDPLTGNSIDIGEAVAEALALALDPYPRAPGAVFEQGNAGAPETSSPFAALAALKKAK